MSKTTAVIAALIILKGCEIVIVYHAMPVLRRLWERRSLVGQVVRAYRAQKF